MTEERKSQKDDEHVEDLDVAESESKDVKGGGTADRKAGKGQQEYLQVKLENVQITSYQL
jgi:type VI protein secretion system component Hcp